MERKLIIIIKLLYFAGDKKEITGLENCFENMAREIIFENMIYI